MKMSGGQRQRISIARALYSRKKLAIFDDVLAGLDLVTERLMFQRVFGHDGLLRKIGTTVVLATHSVKHLPQADPILVLDKNGTVIKQGIFSELKTAGRYIHDLELRLDEESSGHADHFINDGRHGKVDQGAVPNTATHVNESQRTGDWSIYKYYVRALGPLSLVLFFGFVSGTSVMNAMSRKSSQSLARGGADQCRRLAKLVGRVQRTRRRSESWILARHTGCHESHERAVHGWGCRVST